MKRLMRLLSKKGSLYSRNCAGLRLTTNSNGGSFIRECVITRRFSSTESMFCHKCHQSSVGANGSPCQQAQGVCGKSMETSAAHDLLSYVMGGLSQYRHRLGNIAPDLESEIRDTVVKATCAQITNTNYSAEMCWQYVESVTDLRNELRRIYRQSKTELQDFEYVNNETNEETHANSHFTPALWEFMDDEDYLFDSAYRINPFQLKQRFHNKDCWSLRETTLYGLQGAFAYWIHCENLYKLNPNVMSEEERNTTFSDLFSIMNDTVDWDRSMDEWIASIMKVGSVNAKILEYLDRAHSDTFGIPQPTTVSANPVEGKCILVSGHDLVDLYRLLEATKGTGINVYTHNEMLPAHSYPRLRAHDHFVANYGTSWQNQHKEFANFPGAIVINTDCLLAPRKQYRKRLFSSLGVGYDSVTHVDLSTNEGLQTVIDSALTTEGFTKENIAKIEPIENHLTGYSHQILAEMETTIIDGIHSGQLSSLFVIGGCDGSEHTTSYFTRLGNITPKNSIVMTFGCGKNRLAGLKSEMLNIGDLQCSRLMDLGQCNDWHSGAMFIRRLKERLGDDFDKLPIHFALSYVGQKAVVLLLTWLHSGIKNIRLGPSVPTFLTPNVVDYLVNGLGFIKPISVGQEVNDLNEMANESETL